MKILKLRFKNINSLKGHQEIDFTIPPLSISGLFAITGPTGAGKSTILDVITLALFNRIPRFDGKITSTEIENLGSVMTHFTDEAFAEVEYQTGPEAYRSTWKISKTRNNTFRDHEMTLAHLHDGRIMDLKKSEVPGENEKIIGLNYEQFIRSILLSQGEFAKFLKSDKAERTSLLEEITGSKIYRLLGKSAFEKAKLKKEEIQQLKIQIEAIPVLTPENILVKETTLKDNKINLTHIESSLVVKTNLLMLLEKKIQLEQKLRQSKELQAILMQKKAEFEPKESRLQKYKNLDIHRSEITLWTHENLLIQERESEIKVCSQKITFNESLLQESLKEMKTFTRQEISENNFLTEMKNFENKVINLDNQLEIIKEKGIKAKTDLHKILSDNSNNHSKTLQNVHSIGEKIEYCKNVLEGLKSRNKIAEKDDIIREKIATLQQNLILLEKKHFSASAYENAKNELVILSDEKKLAYSQKESFSESMKAILIKINALTPQIDKLRVKKEEQFKIYSLDEHRKMLKSEEPCPLCGSTHHPFAEEKEIVNLGQTEAKIMSLNAALKIAQDDHISISANLSSVVSRIDSIDQQINNKEKSIKILETENPEFKLSSSKANELRIHSEKSNLELSLLQNEVESRLIYSLLDSCKNLLTELNDSASAYTEINKERQKLYQGRDINGDADKIQNKYISAKDVSKEWQISLTIVLENREKLIKIHNEREIVLIQNLSKLGYENINSAISDLLDDKEYQNLLLEKDALIKDDTELSNNMNNLQNEYDALIIPIGTESDPKALKSLIIDLNAQKDTLNHTNGAINNELIKNQEALQIKADYENVLHQKTEAAAVWFIMDKLIGDATGSKYARYAQNLSLRHLIDLANKRLSKLSDRYLLVPSDIETDLTIADLYQGNIKRSVKTLSGGESFIVSLALALSLADMASQNVQLESLFIDEGFGTLDAETLETAIETLEKLQSESNRTIGIISHVESLKERITTQIKVNKNTGGYATVEVTG